MPCVWSTLHSPLMGNEFGFNINDEIPIDELLFTKKSIFQYEAFGKFWNKAGNNVNSFELEPFNLW